MRFELSVPQQSGHPLTFTVESGQCIFVLGANGTGKSSLMHHFYAPNKLLARRISAHRQTWFASSSLTLSPEQKRQAETNIQNTDQAAQSRWKDDYSAQRTNIAIYDLIDAQNVRAREIAEAVDDSKLELAQQLSKADAPIKIINELLKLSGMPIVISVQKNERVLASKSGSDPYSVAELSDGERNALLIAANVLTVPRDTLLLIDEPERHLHRSIISPLLTLLFEKRPDCAFVVSTHDVLLPLDNPSARTLLIRGCTYTAQDVAHWDADLVLADVPLGDSIKKDILGSRRKVLFVEGEEQSLDKPLYSLIFPSVSVIAKSSCGDVEAAVRGIRGSPELHWVQAFGLVDNDGRPQASIEALKEAGVHALPVYTVESIYYHPGLQRRVAVRHAAVTGGNAETLVNAAKDAALAAFAPNVARLSSRAVEKDIRYAIDIRRPTQEQIAAGNPVNITIDVAATLAENKAILQGYLDAQNLEEVICRYPVRETAALTEIAKKLGFQSRAQYENAIRKLLIDDTEALKFVRELFGTLYGDTNV